jgi:hypothetical protein
MSRAVKIGVAVWAAASAGLGGYALQKWWRKRAGGDPCVLAPFSYEARDRKYGKPSFTRVANDSEGSVVLDPAWVAANLTTVFVPELAELALRGVPGAPKDGKLTVNKLVEKDLLAFFSDLRKEKLLDGVTSFGGGFAARLVRGSDDRLSSHALGIALDLNTEENKLGKTPAAEGARGSMQAIARVAKRRGFRWGGCFKNPDGMHLEHGDV